MEFLAIKFEGRYIVAEVDLVSLQDGSFRVAKIKHIYFESHPGQSHYFDGLYIYDDDRALYDNVLDAICHISDLLAIDAVEAAKEVGFLCELSEKITQVFEKEIDIFKKDMT